MTSLDVLDFNCLSLYITLPWLSTFQVYENGVVEGGIDFYFNLSGAMKGIEGGHDAKEKVRLRVRSEKSVC